MAAVPPTFGTMAASMTKEAAGRVQVVRDMDSFEAEVYRQPAAPLAIFFSATFSNLNKGLLEQFTQIAKATNSVAKFLVIDVDEVPRAAYHCGVRLLCNSSVFINRLQHVSVVSVDLRACVIHALLLRLHKTRYFLHFDFGSCLHFSCA